MKLVLDTNVLVAAFIAHGQCNELLEHCVLHHHVVLSAFLLDELQGVLSRKFGFREPEVAAAIQLLLDRCEVVEPVSLKTPVCRDADDDQVIATALAGRCDCIVTGDQDLLCLGEVEHLRMVSPGAFWQYEQSMVEPSGGP